jgi:hypothetical protein
MHIPQVFCTTDGLEMPILRTGILYEVFNNIGSYYKVSVDEYICNECRQTVALPARKAVAVHYQEGYFGIPARDKAHLVN